jgi:hypothetical protein
MGPQSPLNFRADIAVITIAQKLEPLPATQNATARPSYLLIFGHATEGRRCRSWL